MPENLNDLKNLGKESKIPQKPNISSLEKVNNPKPNVTYSVRFTCPEFTSICPVTSPVSYTHLRAHET